MALTEKQIGVLQTMAAAHQEGRLGECEIVVASLRIRIGGHDSNRTTLNQFLDHGCFDLVEKDPGLHRYAISEIGLMLAKDPTQANAVRESLRAGWSLKCDVARGTFKRTKRKKKE